MRSYNDIERPDFTSEFITELRPDEVFGPGTKIRRLAGMDMYLENSQKSGEKMLGPSIALNFRHNFKDTPWDCGILLQVDGAVRDFWHDKNSDNWQSNRTMVLAANGGYNFRQGHKVNPFVNVALGVGFNDVLGDEFIDTNATSPVIIPKIGVELWHILRVNLHVMITRKGFNTYGLTLGLVLGGRPKKN